MILTFFLPFITVAAGFEDAPRRLRRSSFPISPERVRHDVKFGMATDADLLELLEETNDWDRILVESMSMETVPPTSAPTTIVTDSPTDAPNTKPPTASPTSSPTTSPTQQKCEDIPQEELDNTMLDILTAVTELDVLENPETPQGQAYIWMMMEDEGFICPFNVTDITLITERYIAATFYFSTAGDDWKACSDLDTNGNCALTFGPDAKKWLSNESVCTWGGLACDEPTNTFLRNFRLGNNGLAGNLPQELAALDKVRELIVNDNTIVGSIPAGLKEMFRLNVMNNDMSGALPDLSTFSPLLQVFAVSNNNFVGVIDSVANNVNLIQARLSNNAFSGAVIDDFGNLSQMTVFEIQGNEGMTGGMPQAVCNLTPDPLATLTADCSFECDCCTNRDACP